MALLKCLSNCSYIFSVPLISYSFLLPFQYNRRNVWGLILNLGSDIFCIYSFPSSYTSFVLKAPLCNVNLHNCMSASSYAVNKIPHLIPHVQQWKTFFTEDLQ